MTVAQKYQISLELKQRVEKQLQLKSDLVNYYLTKGYDLKEADQLAIYTIYKPVNFTV